MKQKMLNSMHIEGLLYEHDLKLKTTGPNSKNPGTPFISGKIRIATDPPKCVNVLEVNYTYVAPTNAKGDKPNPTFATLKSIIDNGITKMTATGEKQYTTYVRVDSTIGVSDFYNRDMTLVSNRINNAGFIHIIRPEDLVGDLDSRACFKADMLVTGYTIREADPQRNYPETMVIRGYVFDFRNALQPVTFTTTNENMIRGMMSVEPSEKNPVFGQINGVEISETVVRKIEDEVSWGTCVREVQNNRKEHRAIGFKVSQIPFGMEDSMTKDELTKALADREVYLASVKKRTEDYRAASPASAAPSTMAAAPHVSTTATPVPGSTEVYSF